MEESVDIHQVNVFSELIVNSDFLIRLWIAYPANFEIIPGWDHEQFLNRLQWLSEWLQLFGNWSVRKKFHEITLNHQNKINFFM